MADSWMDYVHVNSVDYTFDKAGNIDKILVSMRDQSAVYQFDFATGDLEWILGGKAEEQLTITNADCVTSNRTDDNGNAFTALTFGQHYARYIGTDKYGNVTISVFDNQTGIGPFLTTPTYPGAPTTCTRTFKVKINPTKGTATVFDIVEGTELNTMNDKYHIASHCGSVDYINSSSVVIGWGLHGVIDNIPSLPYAGQVDTNFDPSVKLHQGSRPVFTEYDMAHDDITFELSVTRNANVSLSEGLFSYRTYKSAE